MDTHIDPCLSCGSSKNTIEHDYKRHFQVKCRDCYTRGPAGETKEAAIHAWNSMGYGGSELPDLPFEFGVGKWSMRCKRMAVVSDIIPDCANGYDRIGYQTDTDGKHYQESWTAIGEASIGRTGPTDLMPPIVRYWRNEYSDSVGVWLPSREACDKEHKARVVHRPASIRIGVMRETTVLRGRYPSTYKIESAAEVLCNG